MNNIFFIELIVKSFNNSFASNSYEYQEDDLIKKGVNISELNQYIKDKFQYKFVSELKRQQQILHENDKLKLDVFLDKIKEASFTLNNEVLAYKEKEFQKHKGLSFRATADLDRDSFFGLIEADTELFNIPLSAIVKKTNKEILFNLGDVSFITKTIENIEIADFESESNPEELSKDLYQGLLYNKKAKELFEFLCVKYRSKDIRQIKYVNILHYLKNDVDQKTYVFNIKQDHYRDLIKEKEGITISKFDKSASYMEKDKPVLNDLEQDFRET